MKKLLLLSAVSMALAMGSVQAKEMMGMGTPDASQFRMKVAASDGFEIDSSKVALSKSTDPQITAFANKMIHDHTQSTGKLVALGGISKASIEAKIQPGSDGKYMSSLFTSSQAADLNSLSSKSNADFNKTYIDDQVNAHETALSLLQNYAKNGDNAQLKSFATQMVPIIQSHLAMAKQMQASMGH